MGRLAIIIIAAVGLYAVVSPMRGPDEEMSSMPSASTQKPSDMDKMGDAMGNKADSMSDNMNDGMNDDMPKVTVEQETRQLLAELKSIPVSEYAANKSRYERLSELHPGNDTFMRKVAFYTEKMRAKQSSY